MSTDNFQLEQDPDTGSASATACSTAVAGYSIKFQS